MQVVLQGWLGEDVQPITLDEGVTTEVRRDFRSEVGSVREAALACSSPGQALGEEIRGHARLSGAVRGLGKGWEGSQLSQMMTIPGERDQVERR